VLVGPVDPETHGLSVRDRLMAHRAHLARSRVKVVLGHVDRRVLVSLFSAAKLEAGIKVVEVSTPFRPSAGAPDPAIWQDEHGAVIVCETDDDCLHNRVVFRFQGCLQTRFGYPNDEALGGHPLYAGGLRHYALFEVLNSAWLSDLVRQNRVVFPNDTSWPHRPYRHFVLTFHDSTFEALCMNVGTQATDETAVDTFLGLGLGRRES